MRKFLSLILVFAMLFVFAFSTAAQEARLEFGEDGEFTILHLTDSQDDHHPSFDMLNLVKRSIEETDPDLIVFTGDIVEDSRIGDVGVDSEPGREGVVVKKLNGDIDVEKTLANIEDAVAELFEVLEESGVPYVIAQGNNDHKCGITNEQWLEIYSRYPNCISLDMSDDADGRIDRNIFIYGKDGQPQFNLWILDTGKGGVSAEQIEWYKTRSAEITAQYGRVIPAIVFQHIQVADIGNLFVPCKATDYGATADGLDFYRLDTAIAHGKNFFAYVPGETSEEFTAWKEVGDVIGAFFGHQHVEGFSGVWQGIELGFTYGCEFAKPGPYGYRVINISEDDPLNYDTDLYVYEGNVKLGTDKITKQADEEEKQPDNAVLGFFSKIINFFKAMFKVIVSLFA